MRQMRRDDWMTRRLGGFDGREGQIAEGGLQNCRAAKLQNLGGSAEGARARAWPQQTSSGHY